MRFIAIVLGCLVVCGCNADSVTTPKDPWIGADVMPKSRYLMADESANDWFLATSPQFPAKVRRVRDNLLLLGEGVGSGWYAREDLVRLDVATAYFSRQIHLAPTSFDYAMRGLAWHARNQHQQAIEDYRQALELDSRSSVVQTQLARALSRRPLAKKTLEEYAGEESVSGFLASQRSAYAGALSQEGRYAESIEAFEQAIRQDPSMAMAHNNLAWLLATCPDAEYRDGQRAVELAERACSLSDWDAAYCVDTLAAAYAEQGNFKMAVHWQQRAIDLEEQSGQYLDGGEERLALYQAEQPYREGPPAAD